MLRKDLRPSLSSTAFKPHPMTKGTKHNFPYFPVLFVKFWQIFFSRYTSKYFSSTFYSHVFVTYLLNLFSIFFRKDSRRFYIGLPTELFETLLGEFLKLFLEEFLEELLQEVRSECFLKISSNSFNIFSWNYPHFFFDFVLKSF